MKKFRFPLERARLWRRTLWEQEEMRLERLLGDLNNLRRLRVQLAERLAQAAHRLAASPELTTDDLLELRHIADFGRVEDRRLAERARRAEAEIERQRAAVREARRRFELLDKLREKQFQHWEHEFSRETEVHIGEMAIARWKRSDAGP